MALFYCCRRKHNCVTVWTRTIHDNGQVLDQLLGRIELSVIDLNGWRELSAGRRVAALMLRDYFAGLRGVAEAEWLALLWDVEFWRFYLAEDTSRTPEIHAAEINSWLADVLLDDLAERRRVAATRFYHSLEGCN